MIKRLTFKNYRSFKSKQSLDIKPMTILVGPNSAGKSSIIKLIGLLKQSVHLKRKSELIKYNGDKVTLNSFDYITNNHNGKAIDISFTSQLRGRWFNGDDAFFYDYNFNKEGRLWPNESLRTSLKLSNHRYLLKYSSGLSGCEYSFRQLINQRDMVVREEALAEINNFTKWLLNSLNPVIEKLEEHNIILNSSLYNGYYQSRMSKSEQLQPGIVDREQQNKYGLDSSLSTNVSPKNQNITKRVIKEIVRDYFSRELIFDSFSIGKTSLADNFSKDFFFSGWGTVPDFNEEESFPIFPSIINRSKNNYYKDYDKKILNNPPDNLIEDILSHWALIIEDLDIKGEKYKSNLWAQVNRYIEILCTCYEHENKLNDVKKIKDDLDEINAVIRETFRKIKLYPPIRSLPKSYYTKKELIEDIGIDPAKFHINHYNKFMKNLGYNFTIDIKRLSPDDDLYTIYFKQKSNGPNISLTEMGSGFSQLLPFISSQIKDTTNMLAPYPTLHILEQPELHLHPDAQALLGKELLPHSQASYLVETHSEHFLRGIQVEVSKGNIKKDDVAIYYVGKRKNGNSYIKNLEMTEKGLLEEQWPGGLFEDAYFQSKELLEIQGL